MSPSSVTQLCGGGESGVQLGTVGRCILVGYYISLISTRLHDARTEAGVIHICISNTSTYYVCVSVVSMFFSIYYLHLSACGIYISRLHVHLYTFRSFSVGPLYLHLSVSCICWSPASTLVSMLCWSAIFTCIVLWYIHLPVFFCGEERMFIL